MLFPNFFSGKGKNKNDEAWKNLPIPQKEAETLPENYDTDEELAAAVNAALLLGQPLFLTGEPGTGKTQLAFRLAWELGFGRPFRFETKSTSTARDLFYTYDTLGRFYAAHCNDSCEQRKKQEKDYITYNALGRAILLANEHEKVKKLLPENFKHTGPKRSVVLIDEIDKAPRDFPNDILNEIENMYFRISELENVKIEADAQMSPVVVITSNSEKNLPDPFLRRCVFHHIAFPESDRMKLIMENRLQEIPVRSDKAKTLDDRMLSDAMALFYHLRLESHGLQKSPSTAELIAWLQALREFTDIDNPAADSGAVQNTLGILIKKQEDLKTAKGIVDTWFQNRNAQV
ncbi:MoxR family ATPase [Desulfobacterales bacterium HSG17]|nr:MoxR family ATPase [Desulfobacterales bacterium HSG17]